MYRTGSSADNAAIPCSTGYTVVDSSDDVLTPIILSVLALIGAISIIVLITIYLWEDRLYLNLPSFEVGSEAFLQAHYTLTGMTLLSGNHLRILRDGPEILPAVYASIDAATQTVHLESYKLIAGRVARDLVDALLRAKARGVTVRVILDAIGSVSENSLLIREMRSAGIAVQFYSPLRWYAPHMLNRRDHRKILVVDGLVGFTGGLGFSDEWIGDTALPPWRETHVELRGPAVRELQAIFLQQWVALSGEVPTGSGVFPVLEEAGRSQVQAIASSQKAGSTTMRLLASLAVASATKTIDIASAYLIPDISARRAFSRAIERGVRVRILIPGTHHDVPVAKAITRRLTGSLLRRGVEVYAYQPTMMHAKTLVIDGTWSIVGSMNFDNRSFTLNEEAVLAVMDPVFGAALTEQFEDDLSRSKRLTFEQWKKRSWRERREEFWAMMIRQQI